MIKIGDIAVRKVDFWDFLSELLFEILLKIFDVPASFCVLFFIFFAPF